MTDTIYKKRDPMKLELSSWFYFGFRIKLMVLMYCFRKNFMNSLSFVFIPYGFCSSLTYCRKSKNQLILKSRKEPRHFFQLLINVCYEFNYIFLIKNQCFFEICHFFSYFSQLWEQSE